MKKLTTKIMDDGDEKGKGIGRVWRRGVETQIHSGRI